LLSPMAGWAVVGVGLNARTLVAWSLAAVGVLGCYLVAQAFQEEEDRSRGYRTFVAVYGPQTTLKVARWCYGAGFLVCTVMAVAGWVPRVCLMCVPLGFWLDHWLWRWQAQAHTADVRWANAFVSRLLVSGLAILGLTAGQYYYESSNGLPVAGLGTAAGHPADRPVLSPRRMRAWEARMRVHKNASRLVNGEES
jgi:4-hydroxybenzoate polyprenyltransferase